jgi:ribose transport system ATP-binding protein
MVEAVRLENMTKSFAGVTVLDGVSFDIAPGEIHGLIGENGSGKSTLVKVLAGVHEPDEGSALHLWGRATSFPVRPDSHGIAVIHQDLALCDDMSVAENIGITSRFDTRILAPYSKRREARIVDELSREFGLALRPHAKVGELQPAERAVVAILRAMRTMRRNNEHQLFVLDEPTAALPHTESERLLAMLRTLAKSGAAVLFISHRLHEVLTICDRVSVLRSGEHIGTVEAANVTDSDLVSMMLGYDLGAFYPERSDPGPRTPSFAVDGISGGTVSDVSFDVAKGEILGVTGLAGMGQDDLPYLIAGYLPRVGEVSVDGAAVKPNVRASVTAGIAVVPGNRTRDSLWMGGSAVENLTLPFLDRFRRTGVLSKKREARFCREEMEHFDVRPRQATHVISSFSGGNQQKVVLARWLHMEPKVLLLHEPTQGVDAGAKKELFSLIRKAAEGGAAIAMFSSDLEEIANMCDRVLIMRHGVVDVELTHGELSEDRLISASQGSTNLWELG